MRTAINNSLNKLGGVMDVDTFRTASLSLLGFSAIMLVMGAVILPHTKQIPITKTETLGKPLSVKSLNITDMNSAPQTDIVAEDAMAGFHESTTYGFLPIKRDDGQTIFDAYRIPFTTSATADQQINLIVYDIGLSDSATELALNSLPKNTNIIISPYANNIQKIITSARAKGFEAWLFVPLEPTNFATNDTGPKTLLMNASLEENNKNLLSILGLATGYTGIITDKNNLFTQNEAAYKQFNDTLSARGIVNHSIEISDTIQTTSNTIIAPLTKGTLQKLESMVHDSQSSQKTFIPLSLIINPK
jgi:hypothetical protein